MSSYDVKSKLRGEDLQNLTMQWGYRQDFAPTAKRVDREHDSEFRRNLLNTLAPIINAAAMTAGVATTITAIAWLSGLLVF